MSDIISLHQHRKWKGWEQAHASQQAIFEQWRKLGATDLDIAKMMIADGILMLWDGEDRETFEKIAISAMKEAVAKFMAHIASQPPGGDAA